MKNKDNNQKTVWDIVFDKEIDEKDFERVKKRHYTWR